MEINDKDRIIFEKLILEFEKETKKFPSYSNMLNHSKSKVFIWLLDEKSYNKLLLTFRVNELKKVRKSSPLMKQLFKELFEKDKNQFVQFMILNLNKDNLFNKEFQNIWKIINEEIIKIEDQLLKKVEWWKYSDFSSSIDTKFKNYIKRFFPLINNVWVTIKKSK